MQGQGKKNKFANREEDNQIETNGSSTTENNEAGADANIKLESSVLVTGEEGLDDDAVIEDDRPPKKAKSSTNETPTFIDVKNGVLIDYFGSSVELIFLLSEDF